MPIWDFAAKLIVFQCDTYVYRFHVISVIKEDLIGKNGIEVQASPKKLKKKRPGLVTNCWIISVSIGPLLNLYFFIYIALFFTFQEHLCINQMINKSF